MSTLYSHGVTRFYSRKEKREGRVLLRKLLPKAKELAIDSKMKLNPVAQAKVTAFVIENVDSVCIYHDGAGWQADILLLDGKGGPDVMGTMTAHPVADRAAAEDYAAYILGGILSLQQRPDQAVLH